MGVSEMSVSCSAFFVSTGHLQKLKQDKINPTPLTEREWGSCTKVREPAGRDLSRGGYEYNENKAARGLV